MNNGIVQLFPVAQELTLFASAENQVTLADRDMVQSRKDSEEKTENSRLRA